VATVSGSANFEKSTLEAVTQARASVGQVKVNPSDPASLAEFERAQSGLSSALSRLLVVSEQYPDLKASAGFRDLQVQLEGTENRISVERGRFNEKAQAYNTAILRMPARLFAGLFGMKEKPYFKAVAGSEKAPAVNFNFGPTPAPAPTK
jgi:LemA protein